MPDPPAGQDPVVAARNRYVGPHMAPEHELADDGRCVGMVHDQLPVARVLRASWWRRLLAWWRVSGPLVTHVRIRIPEYAGGGHVDVPVAPPTIKMTARVAVYEPGVTAKVRTEFEYFDEPIKPLRTPSPGPIQDRKG